MIVERVLVVPGDSGSVNDDQAAILEGRERNGYFYAGQAVTGGYRSVRQQAEALSILLILDDGTTAHGDCVSVQYSGAAGRDPVFAASVAMAEVERWVAPALEGAPIDSFREASRRVAALPLTTAVRYGLSQALLDAAARAARVTMGELVSAEYGGPAVIRPIPIFAQTGEDRHLGVDKMIMQRVDELPHGLINSVELVGADGGRLREYVRWVRDRVLEHGSDDRHPVLHFDVYGTVGRVFTDMPSIASYLASLGREADPLRLRIEHPLDAGSRVTQAEAMAALRRALRQKGSTVDLVVDEWCNTIDDIRLFLSAEAADMVHIKTPDLGSLDDAIVAVTTCRERGVAAYFGGSCNETERSAQICAHAAMGAAADLILAKPGMGVHEAVMVTRNEMARAAALAALRGARLQPRAGSTAPGERSRRDSPS